MTVAAASGCSPAGTRQSLYVVVDPDHAVEFLDRIIAFSRKAGLDPQVDSADYTSVDKLNILEARGHGLKLWFQNMPLSGQEDHALCGEGGPRPDPAQYTFHVLPRYPWISKARAEALQSQLVQEIGALGYKVSTSPAPCGRAALSNAATDAWLGQWNGPEGTFLRLEGGKGAYQVTIQNLDGAKTYPGRADGVQIQFERDGVTEHIHATSGAETGMKWLSDKSSCLTVRPGEGYCRDP